MFAGTPAAAVPSLERLAASGHEIVAVVTRPAAPIGRKRVLTPSPVARAAERLGLEVIEAARLDDEATTRLAASAPDLGVIVAYGGLVREPLLSTPVHGWINLHFSLLPAWRGAAPVQHALINDDPATGAAVFQLVAELDAGDVFAELSHRIEPGDTAGSLLETLAERGGALLSDVVDGIAEGTARAIPQAGEPSFAPKLRIDDARIDWNEPARSVLARYRGVTPEPGAWTTLDGARLKLLGLAAAPTPTDLGVEALPTLAVGELAAVGRRLLIGTADVPVEVVQVQPAGRTAMPAADWWRGAGRVGAVAA